MRIVSALAATLLVLAGCAGSDGGPSDPCTEDPTMPGCGPAIGKDQVNDDVGLIRGVVVDATITPVVGAKVQIVNSELQTETDENGGFVFLDLEPRTYFLKVSKAGWTPVQQSVNVEAGVVPDVTRVLLEEAPGTLPYSQFLSFTGYIGCAATMWVLLPNMCASAGDPDQYDIIDFGTTDVPELLQAEIVWEQTQETGRDLSFIAFVTAPDGSDQKRVGNVWGPSPLVCTMTKDADCDNGDGTGGGGDGLNTTGFPGGFYAYLGPGCYQGCIPGTAVGPGIVVQQKYSLYGSAFFNHMPPEGWTLQEMGEYHPPQ